MRLCKEGQTQRASFDGGTPPPFAAGPLSAATGSAPAAAATPSPFAPRPMGSGSVAPALSSQASAIECRRVPSSAVECHRVP